MGIYDRDYMRRQSPDQQMTGGTALFIIIAVNAMFYLFADKSDIFILHTGNFSVNTVMQLFTAGFMHRDFWHLLFNMWGLYIFGKLVTPHLNGKKFFLLYLAGVLTGNLLFIAFNWHSYTSLLGASGAVCAVMTAAATLEPDRKFVMLLFPFAPLKTTTLVICYTVLELLYSFGQSSSNIAHLAHLGGFLGGYIVMLIMFGKNLPWDPLRKIFRSIPKTEFKIPTPKSTSKSSSTNSRVTSQELDALLNKLSSSGINSLTEYELERLRKARRQMRGEDE